MEEKAQPRTHLLKDPQATRGWIRQVQLQMLAKSYMIARLPYKEKKKKKNKKESDRGICHRPPRRIWSSGLIECRLQGGVGEWLMIRMDGEFLVPRPLDQDVLDLPGWDAGWTSIDYPKLGG